MKRRQDVSLGRPPGDPEQLRGFPRADLEPETGLFRVVRRGRGPWWFGSSLDGRFDLPPPEGTCYFATDELSALLEVIGPDRAGGAISTRFLAERGLRRLQVPSRRSLADLTSRRGAGFGLTLEVHTVTPYEPSQAWAASLRQAGAGGLLYFVRHDPSGGYGVALFGRHGERKGWRRGREQPIGQQLLDRLRRECGIEVLGIPRASQLSLEP